MFIHDHSRFRMYKDQLNEWKDDKGMIYMRELAYVEYDLSGDRVGYGSEDWSQERERIFMRRAWVYTWDGSARNKGGKRKFECQGLIRYNKMQSLLIKEFYKRNHNASEVQLRTF